jgi:hypothetical protein
MQSISIKNINSFIKELHNHDWFYMCADDGRAYRRGKANLNELNATAKSHPILQQIFDAWEQSMFSDEGTFDERISKRHQLLDQLMAQVNAAQAQPTLVPA